MNARTADKTTMTTREFSVQFLTPAFLGNAEQSGQWRTPPFKHLLREWWRVAYAEARNFDVNVNAMRREEARLFGAAADGQGNRSLVRMRLGHWNEGKQHKWEADPLVNHREVDRNHGDIGSHLYLGFGPLTYKGGTFLGKKMGREFKANAAIQAGEKNDLKLAFPKSEAALIDRALELMAAFGTLGGRSRNGWGSLMLTSSDPAKPLSHGERGWGEGLPLRDWRECLNENMGWPHAIGRDENGALVWWTRQGFNGWQPLMRELAKLKIGLRTQFPLNSGNHAPHPEARHWLSYPVTHHSVKPWDQAVKKPKIKRLGLGNRLPNMLRFKAQRGADGKLYGMIFHMPHLPPSQFQPDRGAIEQVWEKVHEFLDEQSSLERGA